MATQNIQQIPKGTMNWNEPVNANFAEIKESLEQAEDDISKGNVPVSPTDPRTIQFAIPPRNFVFEGFDLKNGGRFASPASMHDAVASGDYKWTRTGDFWPITLNGTVHDYATNTDKNLANAAFKMEIAGIEVYNRYGDSGDIADGKHHLLMCSRDLLPWTLQYRSENATWYDTAATNPYLGSHLYQTINNPTNGVLPRLLASELGAYVYAGAENKGMRFLGEVKAASATTATSLAWMGRGRLFLPTEREVWGQDVWSEHGFGGGAAVQWPLFAGTLKHIQKGLGEGGSRYAWWGQSSCAGSAANFCCVTATGYPNSAAETNAYLSAPLCFLFV